MPATRPGTLIGIVAGTSRHHLARRVARRRVPTSRIGELVARRSIHAARTAAAGSAIFWRRRPDQERDEERPRRDQTATTTATARAPTTTGTRCPADWTGHLAGRARRRLVGGWAVGWSAAGQLGQPFLLRGGRDRIERHPARPASGVSTQAVMSLAV